MMRIAFRIVAIALCLASFALADGPGDNVADSVRRIPKLGIEVPAEQKAELEKRLADLVGRMQQVAQDKHLIELLPDIVVFYKAAHDALAYQEFFNEREIKTAFTLIDEGVKRADGLLADEAPWVHSTGLVVRGYRSKIDGSIQPYGLVVPESYDFHGSRKFRLDVWFHGRGETLSELAFVNQRMHSPGQYTPRDTIVLHPYGRYSNAFKFAGEVDVLEAIEDVKQRYRIDDDMISVRGFSMGGAACWQFATHYADRWFAANPGAGFAETEEFLRTFQGETLNPTWYERKLWNMYDCTDYAANLYNLPTVAYSGEIDKQKQAADIMAKALNAEGMTLTHVIGPGAAHHIEPGAAKIIEAKLDSIAATPRPALRRRVQLVTYTLRYNRMYWVTIDGMGEHWSRARVDAAFVGDNAVTVTTKNVTDLTLDVPAGTSPAAIDKPMTLTIDGQAIPGAPQTETDHSWRVQLYREGDTWKLGGRPLDIGLRKSHDMQGPIDDAFMDSFIFVRPTGRAANDKVGKWAGAELEHAIEHWRRHFRGEARVVNDTELTDLQIANANIVLWGDPSSNAVMKKIADKLPIKWTGDAITAGDRKWPAANHGLIAIYPNPLNPSRYVVLNSSFTYREFAYLNNARQVPKLPDWAVIDVDTPPDALWPGKVVDADFFDEAWALKPARK
ncbi:MAG: prolyl oligopeptidase family serine peptidase [Phycisphaera sp.]|nr:prolyl oligopeptidase family serine peptidase [Phycisphaera sp.]